MPLECAPGTLALSWYTLRLHNAMPRTTELSTLPSDRDKAGYVRSMFSAIAPRYDLLNRALSVGTDRRWRRAAVDRLVWERAPDGLYLDNCAGTLDLAVELARREGFSGRVVGSDFTHAMLRGGLHKLNGGPVHPLCADALGLPVADHTFHGAVVGFGVRNLAGLESGLREMHRVLRPGGRLVILEFTTPRRQPLRGLYFTYFRHVLPLVGRLISRHGSAYSYLPASVLEFPEPHALADLMREAGFTAVGWKPLTGGIAALHWGDRA